MDKTIITFGRLAGRDYWPSCGTVTDSCLRFGDQHVTSRRVPTRLWSGSA